MSSGHSRFLSGICPFCIEFVFFRVLCPVTGIWFAKVFSQCLYFNCLLQKIQANLSKFSFMVWAFSILINNSFSNVKGFSFSLIYFFLILYGLITLHYIFNSSDTPGSSQVIFQNEEDKKLKTKENFGKNSIKASVVRSITEPRRHLLFCVNNRYPHLPWFVVTKVSVLPLENLFPQKLRPSSSA